MPFAGRRTAWDIQVRKRNLPRYCAIDRRAVRCSFTVASFLDRRTCLSKLCPLAFAPEITWNRESAKRTQLQQTVAAWLCLQDTAKTTCYANPGQEWGEQLEKVLVSQTYTYLNEDLTAEALWKRQCQCPFPKRNTLKNRIGTLYGRSIFSAVS